MLHPAFPEELVGAGICARLWREVVKRIKKKVTSIDFARFPQCCLPATIIAQAFAEWLHQGVKGHLRDPRGSHRNL